MHMKLVAGVSYGAILLSSICAYASGDTPVMPHNAPAASACATIAGAKSTQWDQKQFMVRETQTFADGRTKVVEAIFTPDSGYARVDNGPWTSMNLVRRQRAAPLRDLVKRMGLQDCGLSGSDGDAKKPVSIYSYGYLPDSSAAQVTGKMWIDDSSQLPIRQELAQSESSQRNLPVSIDASYAYGEAVIVPADAVRSDERRRWIETQVFLRNGIGAASGGDASPDMTFRGKHH